MLIKTQNLARFLVKHSRILTFKSVKKNDVLRMDIILNIGIEILYQYSEDDFIYKHNYKHQEEFSILKSSL